MSSAEYVLPISRLSRSIMQSLTARLACLCLPNSVRGAFRILGCKTVKRVTSDIDLAPGQEKHSENKVVLTCPVELPKPSRGPPKKK